VREHPVLLSGGSGTRLWPLSRKSFPKQFADLGHDETLFQAAARLLSGPGYAPPSVITASDFRFIVAEQLAMAGIDPGAIVIEPAARNTAPAILAMALHLAKVTPEALMLVAPSDHVMPDAAAFRAAVRRRRPRPKRARSSPSASAPTDRKPATAGWSFRQHPAGIRPCARRIWCRFVEKPDAATAEKPAGLGAASLECRHLPDFGRRGAEGVRGACTRHASGRARGGRSGPDRSGLHCAWRPAPGRGPDISVDYAVMERPRTCRWCPWRGLVRSWRLGCGLARDGPDADGVVTHGPPPPSTARQPAAVGIAGTSSWWASGCRT
jgi:mannose-1-phosphate guanylyltransferase / mannose-6-phosphate isomerase